MALRGGGINAAGDGAFALELIAAVYGSVFLGAFLLSTVLAFSRSRDDSDLRATIAELRTRARTQEADVRAALRMGIDDALQRLRDLGFGGIEVIYAYLRSAIPAEYLREETETDSP